MPRQLVRDVTAGNYAEIGRAFIGMFGGAVISLEDARSQDITCPACPRQWGAWRAYFKARKINTVFMDTRGRGGAMYTVPAAWPHEFDGDATVQGDNEAGERFMRNYRPARIDMADAAHRMATVAAYKRWRTEGKKQELPQEPISKPASLIDKDRLLDGYERDMAEWNARKAKKAGEAA